ncbi:zinc-binding dehydrogenase [Ornithinibacillus salinisoli]|uniref:Zinc-binding dehydrogenase n=1 Tax=Ornithinibacillus salinisoli TaxID=1848459 RepID=A0ABW4VWL2_9BACI
MKAFVHENGNLKVKIMDEPIAKKDEVVVSIRYAGLNRRDLYIPNRRGDNPDPLILGSDGAGVIDAVGDGVGNFQIGDEVIINPSLRWYEKSDAPPEGFDILGMPDHGTFAEKIVISAEQVEKKPAYLSWDEASAIALPALTGYRALFTKGQVKAGDTVFIPGAGSGVATYVIMFAKNIGAKVIVTSRSEKKREQAIHIGADMAIDTKSDWVEELKNETIDLVIESVGEATFNRSLEVLKKGGRMVTFGATTEDTITFNLRSFFYGQYQLFGSTMGSKEELREMLKHMEKHQTHPVIDCTYTLDEAQKAFDYLEANKQFGKVILKIES